MSMQRDDFSGLPDMTSGTIITHVNKARALRSRTLWNWLRRAPRQRHVPAAEVIPFEAQPTPVRTPAAAGHRTGPDCIRYAG
ncbi:MAG: hypothetical protein AAGA11_18645 [Pseudomonadota bacterium]